jgi:hypothetical protein
MPMQGAFLTKFSGCDTKLLFESSAEVAGIVETPFESDIGNRNI